MNLENIKNTINNIFNGPIDMKKVFSKWFLLGHAIILGFFIICMIIPLAAYFKPFAYLMLSLIYVIPLYLFSLFLIGLIGIFKQKISEAKFISFFLFFYSILAIFLFFTFFGSFFGFTLFGQFLNSFINKILM